MSSRVFPNNLLASFEKALYIGLIGSANESEPKHVPFPN